MIIRRFNIRKNILDIDVETEWKAQTRRGSKHSV